MRRVIPLLMSFVMCAGFIACSKAEKALDQVAIAKDLKDKGTLELMKEAAEDEYEPPADSRLTDKQVQMYLKVREHEKQIVQVARKQAEASAKKMEGKEKSLSGLMAGIQTLGSVADMVTADVRAAKDLGFNTAEYTWVKGQILEASGAALGEKMSESFTAMVDGQIESLKKQIAETSDETTRKMLQEALEGAEKSKAEMAQQTQQEASVTYNKQLLSKYEDALNALTHELSKWENKEGEAQDTMKKLQQDAEKANQ